MTPFPRIVFGSGKLATHLMDANTLCIPRVECDISSIDSVRRKIHSFSTKPTTIINCAAKTNLEYCEDNKSSAYMTNTLGVINLLHLCAEYGIKFVHISSGCLFDGNSTVSTEESQPTPAAWYTHTKTWADDYIKNYGYNNYLILRPRQMISAIPHPTNMITKFCNYEQIFAHKEQNSITCVEDFCDMLAHLVKIDATGIFNCCNEGTLTPYDIAVGIKRHVKPSLKVEEATYEHTLTLQPNRRVNTILSNEKLKSTGYNPRHCAEALEWCLKTYFTNLANR